MKSILLIGLLFFAMTHQAQKSELSFRGELSMHTSYSFDNDLEALSGGRYLPELNWKNSFDSSRFVDFTAGVNLYGSSMFHPFDTFINEGAIRPYRLWGRFSTKHLEIRLGLQKINFGSATLLRPLQWFDQIDPRDPLQFTNGVYALMGRYYFQNNANIWFWTLYGNKDLRGFESFPTHENTPEMGGRVQYPVPKGEVGVNYHYRKADFSALSSYFPSSWTTNEHRFGLDGKWDVGVGLWFEATHTFKDKDLNLGTHQSMIAVGADYTFGIGNGLNIIAENLLIAHDKQAFHFERTSNISALMASYPLGYFDNLSFISYYLYSTDDYTFILNYQHSFKYINAYLLAFYAHTSIQAVAEDNFGSTYSGPGIRLMLVYNH
jgi:hypothetical protein